MLQSTHNSLLLRRILAFRAVRSLGLSGLGRSRAEHALRVPANGGTHMDKIHLALGWRECQRRMGWHSPQESANKKRMTLVVACAKISFIAAVPLLFYSWIGIADANTRTLGYLQMAYQNTNKDTIATQWIVNAAPSSRFPYKNIK